MFCPPLGSFFQHLSKAVGMVTKSVLMEHLITVASSMTCTGSLHGFNRSGYEATFQSLKVQAPFTKATLSVSVVHFFLVPYFGAPVPIANHNTKMRKHAAETNAMFPEECREGRL